MATLFPSFRCTFSALQIKSSSGYNVTKNAYNFPPTTCFIFWLWNSRFGSLHCFWPGQLDHLSSMNLKIFSWKIFSRFIKRKSWWLTSKAFHWLIYFRFVWSKINWGWPDRLSDGKLTKPCHEISKIRRKENNINEFLSSWR